jgi:hypothetical protein
MLQKMRVLLLVCFTVVLAACGGGDSADSTPNFAGNYLISTLNLNSNNCNAAVPGTIAGGTDTVTQNGRAISIGTGSSVISGSVDADNGGFTVSLTQVSNGIPVLSTFAIRTITAGSKYEIRYTTTAGTCSAVYVGTATKI